MAATFYSLQEAAQKLGRTEQQVKQLVKEGKLREFRDGTKQLFRIEDVEKLASEPPAAGKSSEVELVLDETGELTIEETGGRPKSEGGFNLSNIGDISAAETAAGTAGISVLGESDPGHKPAGDSKSETQQADIEGVASLDADVNLESFGSGSGLLDLSLQADDTSLGAVLDDILPAAGEVAEPAEPVPAAGVAAEADKIFEQAGPEAAVPAGEAVEQVSIPSISTAPQYAEPQPDATSNTFGYLLFLPLVMLMLTAIVLAAASRGIKPAILDTLGGSGSVAVVWYIAGGMVVLAGLVAGAASVMGGKK